MREFLSLRILDLFRGIFEKVDIDFDILKLIVKTKLNLDMRRSPVIANDRKNNKESNSFIKGYIVHLIFGLFLALLIYIIKDEMIRMIYFTGAFFFMTTMYLISDFSFVLLDTKDKNILLTRPVDSRTVSMAKLIHILIYMFRLNTFIAGPSLIAVVMTNGAFAIPVFIFEILMMDLLIFLLTAFIYILVLKLFDGETLRNIINLIQILLTVLVSVGYQIAVRVIDFTSVGSMAYKFKPVHYINPILWFGAPYELIFNRSDESYLYIFTILLIVVPVICFLIYFGLSKKMESLLMKLEGEGKEKASKHIVEVALGKILNFKEAGREAFHFSNAMLRSDRSLKLKIYPALSTGILLPIIMIFSSGLRGNYEVNGYEYLYLYFNFMVFSSINLVLYSSAWKGAYIYISSGFENIRELYIGLMKSLAVRIIIPLMLFNSAIYIILFKGRFIADLIVIMVSSVSIIPIIGKLYLTTYPFSKPIGESNGSQPMSKFFIVLGISIIYALLHFFFHKINFGIWIYMFVQIAAVPIIWKISFKKENI